jgi:ABC-type uncharacterized transport system permease subunit
MENIPLSIIIIFLLGQLACLVSYTCAKPGFKFVVLLQGIIFSFSALMWAVHAPDFGHFPAPLKAHILSVILAHWFLVFAFVGGVLVVLKEKSLKSHKNNKKLPSLQNLENTQFQTLALSFGAMVSAVVLGEWYLYSVSHLWLTLNIKVILSFSLCALIGILLYMHHKWGTRGQKAARFILFSYIIFIVILGISHI